MGYIVDYYNPSNNKAIAINRDKVVYIELDREAKSLKIVYGFGIDGDKYTTLHSDNIAELEEIFNLIANEDK